MTILEEYYNKFNEEKRLNSRHGHVEFVTSMKYIHRYLDLLAADGRTNGEIRILDIGAATGRYSVPLCEEGYDVTAVEPVKHNLSRLKQKNANVKAYQGNALNLKRFADSSFDLTLVFGPMYHLHSMTEKEEALSEAVRVTADGGYILVVYIMNEFCVLTHAFKDRHILESVEKGQLTDDFRILCREDDLYSLVRLEDIDALNNTAQVRRVQILTQDGPANYMRRELNALTEEEFDWFIRYHLATCERPELLGASGHILDILQKREQGINEKDH